MRRTLYFILNLLKTPFRLCQWDRMSFSLEILTGSGCVYANELGGGGGITRPTCDLFSSASEIWGLIYFPKFSSSRRFFWLVGGFHSFQFLCKKSSFNRFDANFIQSGLQVDLWWPVKFEIIVWWPKPSVPQSCARFRLMISLTLPLV